MKKKPLISTAVLALAIVLLSASLAACAPATPEAAPTQDPNVIASAAVQTYAAGITASAAALPSDTPIPPTNTPFPATNTPAAPSEPTATYYIAPLDEASFVGQKPLDGAEKGIGEDFRVSWTVRNEGETTWTKEYSIRYYSEANLGLKPVYYFPNEVAPGEEITLTVVMHAPDYPASLKSNWVLTNADGQNFYDLFFEVKIVKGKTSTPTPTSTFTPTPGPSPTPVIG